MAEKNYAKLNLTLVHNLKKKIEELKKSEENYKGLFDNAVDAMFVANPITRQVVDCNKSAEKLMGYSRDKILSMKADDIHPKELRKKTMEGFKKQAEGKIKSIFSEVLTKDNKRIPIEISASGINIGNERYIQAIFRDISERKKSEQALRESESKFRTIFENANDGILVADAKTKKFIFANPKICELTGYALQELLDLGIGDIHPKKDLPYVIGQFTKQLQHKLEVAKDIPVLRKDNSVVYCDVNSATANINGKDVLVGFFRDMSERKESEEKLKESEEKYKAIVENATDWIFVLDKKCKFLSLNKSVANLFRMPAEKVIGKSIFEIFPKKIAFQFLKNNEHVFKTGKSKFIEENMIIGNREFWINTTLNQIKDNKGKVTAVMGITKDITERKEAEEKIKESKEKYKKEINELKKKLKKK